MARELLPIGLADALWPFYFQRSWLGRSMQKSPAQAGMFAIIQMLM